VKVSHNRHGHDLSISPHRIVENCAEGKESAAKRIIKAFAIVIARILHLSRLIAGKFAGGFFLAADLARGT